MTPTRPASSAGSASAASSSASTSSASTVPERAADRPTVRGAVPRRAPRVAVHDGVPGPGEHLHLVEQGVGVLRERPAVDHEHHRVGARAEPLGVRAASPSRARGSRRVADAELRAERRSPVRAAAPPRSVRPGARRRSGAPRAPRPPSSGRRAGHRGPSTAASTATDPPGRRPARGAAPVPRPGRPAAPRPRAAGRPPAPRRRRRRARRPARSTVLGVGDGPRAPRPPTRGRAGPADRSSR